MSINEEQVRFWVRAELRKILDSGLIANETVKPKQPTTPPTTKIQQNVAPHVSEAFNPQLAKLLNFTEENDKWVIKGKEFLSSEAFRETLDTVLAIGGEYISGKNAHFEVPKQ